MSPIETLSAAASRLNQEANTLALREKERDRLREIAEVMRGAVATIRSALEGNERQPRHARFGLIVGDEGQLPNADRLE